MRLRSVFCGNHFRLFIALLFITCVIPHGQAWAALCNGGTNVSSTLTISASCDGAATKPLTLDTGADVTINSGVIVSNDAGAGRNGDPISILSTATSSSIVNNGTISTGSQWAVTNNGVLTSITNFGTISSGVRRGIVNATGGVIGTITNAGTVSGPFAGITQTGTSITTINNLQGAGNGGMLTIAAGLPSNYNIIIRSTSQYGQFYNQDGIAPTMSFNIYGNTGTTLVSNVAASTIAKGTYADVLRGFTTLTGISGTTGTYNGLTYSLVAGSGAGYWSLLVTNAEFTSAATPNQSSIAGMFNRLAQSASGAFGNLIDSIGTLSSAGQQQAFDQLSSSAGSNLQNTGVSNTRAMVSSMQSRLSGSVGGGGAEAPLKLATFDEVQIADASDINWASLVTMRTPSTLVAWIQGVGEFNYIEGTSTAPGIRSSLGGGTVGIEARFDTDTRAGVMFGAANNNFTVNNIAQWGSQNSYVVGLYGSMGALGGSEHNGIVLDGTVLAGYITAESNRLVSLVSAVARGETDGYSFAASGGVSYPITLDEGPIVTPRFGLAYTYNYENGYTETGAAGANLSVNRSSQHLVQTSLGTSIKHKFEIEGLSDDNVVDTLTPEASIGWLHEVIDPRSSITESFSGIAGSSFSTAGATPSRDAAALGFSLSYNPGDAASTIYARYETALSSNQTDQSIVAGLKYSW